MNVAKFKVHIENAFRADHVSAPSRPVNHCVNKAGLTEGQRLKSQEEDSSEKTWTRQLVRVCFDDFGLWLQYFIRTYGRS